MFKQADAGSGQVLATSDWAIRQWALKNSTVKMIRMVFIESLVLGMFKAKALFKIAKLFLELEKKVNGCTPIIAYPNKKATQSVAEYCCLNFKKVRYPQSLHQTRHYSSCCLFE